MPRQLNAKAVGDIFSCLANSIGKFGYAIQCYITRGFPAIIMRTRIHVAALLALASTASCDIFTPSITTASSTYTDCAAALGTNYFECSPPSGSQPRLLCFNPSAGETCCESLCTSYLYPNA